MSGNSMISGSTGGPLPDALYTAMDRLPLDNIRGFVVAYSGGVDSHVLLQCAAEWCQLTASGFDAGASDTTNNKARPRDFSLRAHHIDHGLQAQSAQWAAHCETVCGRLRIPLTATRVAVDLKSGYSPEDAARRARYDALMADLQADEVLLLGQHADDQAETLLLQLLRGAGVNGLAGMPVFKGFGRGHIARPMLQVTSATIRQYAGSQGLQWVEDPSNRDDNVDRNLLRNQVLPLLKSRWPAAVASIARSASHCAEAAMINRAYTQRVLGEHIDDRRLSLQRLSTLSSVEQKTVLRNWIEHHGYQRPSTAKLAQVLTDMINARDDSAGDISWGDVRIRKYRQLIYLGARDELSDCRPFRYHWESTAVPLTIVETGTVLTREDIPVGYRQVPGGLLVCSRVDGARIKLAGSTIHKPVKKLFQECSTPPWERGRFPFVYADGKLVGIIGMGFSD
jgi:tRNA(Ile)-lysidine synthase